MYNIKVSIVICTCNRAPYLQRTLNSLFDLNYKNFEVIVVNGPSTDETVEILQLYKHAIKIRTNPERNLSVSRNIGIKAAAGDIVAFIDDDAIPDPNWLNDIVSYYTDDSIGGVGGKVYGPGGDHFQFTNGIIDIWGEPEALRPLEGDYNDPKGKYFNILMGTNATFSRKALVDIGGFDEYFEYYHDESDVAVRLIKKGYKILHHPNAYVHHEFAKSNIRTNVYKLNWYPIVKNTVYFGIKNSENHGTEKDRKENVTRLARRRLNEFKYWKNNGYITGEDYRSFTEMWEKGYKRGLNDGFNMERKLNYNLEADSPFLPFDIKEDNYGYEKLSICLLCQDNPVEQVGGVAKYTWQLAKGYASNGHEVHILTKGKDNNFKIIDNIFVHEVAEANSLNIPEIDPFPVTKKNVLHSYSLYQAIMELNKKYYFDIIESPIWDFEGVLPAKLLDIPLVTRLQTPLLKAAETQNWNINEDIKLAADFERNLIKMSSGIIAISEGIKETIAELYNVNFADMFTETIYIGVDSANEKINAKNNDSINVLFVGRLERRKGIHVLLNVIPDILTKYENVVFTFVGDDTIKDEDGITYKEKFLSANKGKKYLSRVEFKGKVDTKELEEHFKSCDLFVSPSLYESFGIIFIEAMRFGKPVIGAKAGGMPEIIKDRETGFLVEPDNAADLQEKLSILIDDAGLRKAMGINALEWFNSNFTTNAMVERSLEFYKKVIKRVVMARTERDYLRLMAQDVIERTKPYRIPVSAMKIEGWDVCRLPEWRHNEAIKGSKKGSFIELTAIGSIMIKFLKHGWSGTVNILINDELKERIDLYSKDADYDFTYKYEIKVKQANKLKIEISDERNPESQGSEAWIEGIYLF